MVVFMIIVTSLFFAASCFDSPNVVGVVGLIYNVCVLTDWAHFTGFVGLFLYLLILVGVEFLPVCLSFSV